MTLSPVFRSPEALEALVSRGYLDRLAPSVEAQRDYQATLRDLLGEVIDARYIRRVTQDTDDIRFLQEHFFLLLFDSVYRTLGCPPSRLTTYGLLNLCLKGLVVSGDNLFDGEAKMDLPLALGQGRCFGAIMQMLCFDHLVMRVLESHASDFDRDMSLHFRRELLSSLASIGTLEGSEEAGVSEVPPVEKMIETVHAVRGGQLFSLAFIAPLIAEPPDVHERWKSARSGIARLGTAFQIVDDLTDFEFDLTRGSNNVLAAQIVHQGTAEERSAFERIRRDPAGRADAVEADFVHSARAVFRRACLETERAFELLSRVGFWLPPSDAELFVRAIAGDAGDRRMQAITDTAPAAQA
jgi:hypothetical protein